MGSTAHICFSALRCTVVVSGAASCDAITLLVGANIVGDSLGVSVEVSEAI